MGRGIVALCRNISKHLPYLFTSSYMFKIYGGEKKRRAKEEERGEGGRHERVPRLEEMRALTGWDLDEDVF